MKNYLKMILMSFIFCGITLAQDFPNRAIKIVVPFTPGGGSDVITRLMAEKMTGDLGVSVIVENKPGASSIIGTDYVAKSAPDGYTLLITNSAITINPSLFKLPFDTQKLTPVTKIASAPQLLVATTGAPFKNLKEMLAYAKANPGKVNFYSSGNGGLPHLTGELLNNVAGIQTVHIAYKGSAPGMNDLIGGQVQLGYDTVAIGLQHIKTGRLRALATTGPKRLAILPDVPSTSEFASGLEAVNWYGMVVPAGTPREAILRLNREITKVLEMPDIKEKLVSQGIDPAANSPEEFGEFMKSEAAKWARVIRAANIKPDS
jgi:tripartite-type tricarboxylate transporter receptor subunit TctC